MNISNTLVITDNMNNYLPGFFIIVAFFSILYTIIYYQLKRKNKKLIKQIHTSTKQEVQP